MMSEQGFRTESDSMGELQVAMDALYGAQTQRAVDNFAISGLTMPRRFIQALGLIKASAAEANQALGDLDPAIAGAIVRAAEAVADGEHDAQFPVDVFQTGSGTSSNMNANEVIAHLATADLGATVHPNDHVNMGQSSNDVIPTAIHVAAAVACSDELRPALDHLAATLERRADELSDVTTTGRTHLMDAMPVTLGQEIGGWAYQVRQGEVRVGEAMERIRDLAQGGTAVGTGINARPEFGGEVATALTRRTGVTFRPSPNRFESLSSQDAAVELSGQLKTVAVSLMKISNDLRWMNSGPLAGLGEIALPALQPGSSIMPGKVNPVIPEAVAQVSAQVIGNDTTITVAGQSGNFQLNVMLPVVAHNLLQSISLLANGARALADRAVAGFTVNRERLEAALGRNPILVTALNTAIGYELGAKIAKRAYAEGRPLMELAREMTDLADDELERLLDPKTLTAGGIPGAD
ncbi:fumarase class II [Spiribacter vilamensis]|uniref:Fumarate hydratase class II n=2 Tax=Spiribacter vilamensis TaxID=531306 RepID=A0A4Q8D041_9GAMM|nr:fumarase class II [Spiribacter vilamensis]